MKKRFYKTNHFWDRAWERGLNQSEIDALLSNVAPQRGKHIAIFGKNAIKKAGVKATNKSHLVIVMRDNILLTLFVVWDLYGFMKTHVNSNFLLF